MTVDPGFLPQDHGLRATSLGTDNFLMGATLTREAMKLKPAGGSVGLQLGNHDTENINERLRLIGGEAVADPL